MDSPIFEDTRMDLDCDPATRLAARRMFVEIKQLFLRAADAVAASNGAWLRHQVRLANEPMDLWLLRGPLLAALRRHDGQLVRQLRAQLYHQLDSTFPEAFGLNDGATLPMLPEPWEIWAAGAQTAAHG